MDCRVKPGNGVVEGMLKPEVSHQKPYLAQIARVSSAEISWPGSPAMPSGAIIVPAPDLRPNSPDNSPVDGAITGVCTLSPYWRPQHRAQIADGIAEAQRYRGLARPNTPPEQHIVACPQPRAPALFHQRDEEGVDLLLQRFHPRHVVRILRQERIQHRLVFACGVEPPLDADFLDQS